MNRRLICVLLCGGLLASGCAGAAVSTQDAASTSRNDPAISESTAPSTTIASTTLPSTTTAAPPKRLEADGGVVLVVPARLDLRVVGTSVAPDLDPNLRGTIVEIASSEGTYLTESFEISFPRRDQPATPTFSSDRVAYFDPAAKRWVALATTIGNDRMTAKASIASKYALLQWSPTTPTFPLRRWPLPDRSAPLGTAAPTCETPPPPWLRDVFTFANATALVKTCIESIAGGVRVRIANNTTFPLPIVFNTDTLSIAFTDVPARARAIQPYLESQTTSRTVLTGPGVTIAADFAVAAKDDGAITARLDTDPAFRPFLYLFEILDLPAPGHNQSLQAITSANTGRTLVAELASCILDEPNDNTVRQVGSTYPYVDKTTACIVGRLDAAIAAIADSRPIERAVRDLRETNPARAEALGLAIALRNMLRAIEARFFYDDIVGSRPDSPGEEIAVTWGPQPRATVIVNNVPSLLFGVPLGVEAEQAITALTRLLGPPTKGWGWGNGCPFFGPTPMIRALWWGALQVSFSRYPSGDRFDGWSYETERGFGPAVGGPTPDQFIFPNGVKLEMTMGEVSGVLSRELRYWDVFQHLSVRDEGSRGYGRKQYFGSGANSPETKFTGYSEPGLAYCE